MLEVAALQVHRNSLHQLVAEEVAEEVARSLLRYLREEVEVAE